MFRGFATISFTADDLGAASAWYAELLGVQPYYSFPPAPAEPAYVEFRVGDDEDELGIIDRRYAPGSAGDGPGGAVMFWHVDDLPGTLATLLRMGAVEHEPLTEREAGFATASVVDPFGNVLGVMHNPHYLEVLAARRG
ncbi:VOC family protein [Nocardioides sp. zg-1228]|uniref:VOC family protein n=1 Tax=Nocardioides sp. zg-1228 TaxID=2763008 RepID=UPI0016424282|nr:VOC family protein [Nocardioides sp. zg-1228]MBC2931504.1 VOC family protein [Nocardioides sp. zg-1228]QSF57109.1 VOC family protein [Nocardioides sp. zg-1228]